MKTRLVLMHARLEGTLEAALAAAEAMVSQTSTGVPVDEIHNAISRDWSRRIGALLADVRGHDVEASA